MNLAKLRGKRAELGFTQNDCGNAIGKTGSSYSRRENGETEFTPDEICSFTIEAKLSFDEFNDIFFDGRLPFGNTVR